MKISICNTTRLDKNQDEWINNENYKSSGGSKFNYTDEDYLEIIKEAIPNKLEEFPFVDQPLTENESYSLKKVFEGRIKKLLIGRQPIKYGRPTIQFLGEEIKLDVFPTAPNMDDMLIFYFYESYSIIEECLKENKPVYLSITEENE